MIRFPVRFHSIYKFTSPSVPPPAAPPASPPSPTFEFFPAFYCCCCWCCSLPGPDHGCAREHRVSASPRLAIPGYASGWPKPRGLPAIDGGGGIGGGNGPELVTPAAMRANLQRTESSSRQHGAAGGAAGGGIGLGAGGGVGMGRGGEGGGGGGGGGWGEPPIGSDML